VGTASSVGEINDKRDVSILSDGILNEVSGERYENHRHTHSCTVLSETFHGGTKLRKPHDPFHRLIEDENGRDDAFLKSSNLSEKRCIVTVEVTTSCGVQELQSAVNLRRDSLTEFMHIIGGIPLVIKVVHHRQAMRKGGEILERAVTKKNEVKLLRSCFERETENDVVREIGFPYPRASVDKPLTSSPPSRKGIPEYLKL